MQPALAKQDDRNQPMNVVRADRSDGFNAPNSITTLTGNIVLTQGTMKVTGDLAKIYFDADQQVSRVVVTADKGKLAHIQQLNDNNELMTGDADKLDYDNINGIAVLTGNAVVHEQNHGEAHGDKLTYNTNTAYMTGDSASNGFVHMIFLPKPKPAAATSTPAKAAVPASAPHPTTPSTAKPASASSTPTTPVAVPAPASSASTPVKGQP